MQMISRSCRVLQADPDPPLNEVEQQVKATFGHGGPTQTRCLPRTYRPEPYFVTLIPGSS